MIVCIECNTKWRMDAIKSDRMKCKWNEMIIKIDWFRWRRVQLGKQFGGRDSVKDLGLLSDRHGVKGPNPWAVHFDEEDASATSGAGADPGGETAAPGVMGAANGNPSIRSSTGAGKHGIELH